MQKNVSKFKVTPVLNPGGETTFNVSGTLNGEQRRKRCKTEAEAIGIKQAWELEALNVAAPVAITTRLTEAQAREAEAIFHRIGAQSLTQLVDYALLNFRPSDKALTVSAAWDKFQAAKLAANLRDASLRTLKQRLNRLVKTHGTDFVSVVSSDAIRLLIFREGSGNVNRESDYRAFTNFFNWCVEQGFCSASPMSQIDPIALDEREPEILNVAECRALMHAACAHKDGKLVPYFVLALFCAIRPTELARLSALGRGKLWEAIDLQAKTVTIGPKIAKMRARRIVTIPDNAVAWLADFEAAKPLLVPSNWRKDFDAVKSAAGFGTGPGEKPWPMDVLRHTGISMHLAKHNNEGLTASWAGNSPDIIHRHYKALVKPTEVQPFYAILPAAANVIALPAAS